MSSSSRPWSCSNEWDHADLRKIATGLDMICRLSRPNRNSKSARTRTHMPNCPDCALAMHPGFILESIPGGAAETKWVRGPAEKSFWRGVNVEDKERLAIVAHRCPQCGLLRLYAPEV